MKFCYRSSIRAPNISRGASSSHDLLHELQVIQILLSSVKATSKMPSCTSLSISFWVVYVSSFREKTWVGCFGPTFKLFMDIYTVRRIEIPSFWCACRLF